MVLYNFLIVHQGLNLPCGARKRRGGGATNKRENMHSAPNPQCLPGRALREPCLRQERRGLLVNEAYNDTNARRLHEAEVSIIEPLQGRLKLRFSPVRAGQPHRSQSN